MLSLFHISFHKSYCILSGSWKWIYPTLLTSPLTFLSKSHISSIYICNNFETLFCLLCLWNIHYQRFTHFLYNFLVWSLLKQENLGIQVILGPWCLFLLELNCWVPNPVSQVIFSPPPQIIVQGFMTQISGWRLVLLQRSQLWLDLFWEEFVSPFLWLIWCIRQLIFEFFLWPNQEKLNFLRKIGFEPRHSHNRWVITPLKN